jgi:hypothetical protein
MDNIDKIKLSKKNLQDEIMKEIVGLVDIFKAYVTVNHTRYPKYQIIEGICTKVNYGIIKNDYPDLPLKLFENRENNNYYCFLPEKIEFFNRYSSTRKWYSNLIFYNEKLNCWFVYNNDKIDSWRGFEGDCLKKIDYENVEEFTSLDIETQIAFLEQLENLLK